MLVKRSNRYAISPICSITSSDPTPRGFSFPLLLNFITLLIGVTFKNIWSLTSNSKCRWRFYVYFFCSSIEGCNLLFKSQYLLGLYLLLLVPKTFSTHSPGKSNAQTLGMTSKICIICSPYPSVWGWEAVSNSNLVLNPACNFFQNIEVSLTSRSNTIETGTLCNYIIPFKYNIVSFSTGSVVFTGKKWASLVIWSTIA